MNALRSGLDLQKKLRLRREKALTSRSDSLQPFSKLDPQAARGTFRRQTTFAVDFYFSNV